MIGKPDKQGKAVLILTACSLLLNVQEIEYGSIKVQRWSVWWRGYQLSSSRAAVPKAAGHAPVQSAWHAARPNVALHHPAALQQCEPHLHLPIDIIKTKNS